ncbi:F-box only protein 22-like [Montipora foliosa]|uniref:F-box only protein 22-like n=1 Tax=Montipora foliosa TaxID=591990 RepID=UPI0035F16CF8
MAAKESIWDIAEIVEIILRFLPGRYIATAAQVSRLWRDTVERIRRSRRECVVYLTPNHLNFTELSSDVLDFLTRQCIEPRALLLFSGAFPSSSPSRIKSFLQSIQNCLPSNCPFIGCTGLGVIGSGRSLSSHPSENSQGLSLMMFPRCERLEVRDFYVPLRNKYKKISGVKSFLPDMTLPVKLVIVLAHPLSLGKLTHLTLALRSKYGDDVLIVGGYSDSYLFYNSEVTSREIIGLVFAGNLQASSTVITGGTKLESLKNLHDSIQSLVNCDVQKDETFSLMFSCFSRGSMTYGYEHAEYIALREVFPHTALAGFYGTAAFGCDREKLKLRGLKPGGRDFLHIDASVLCLGSLVQS